MRTILMTLLLAAQAFTQSPAAPQSKAPSSWKYELPEEIKKFKPIDGGDLLFLWSDEYAWLYETATGKKIWSVKIDEYNEKAVHALLNDTLYLVADEDTLLCYDIRKNRLLWKKTYAAIEQDRFSGIFVIDTLGVLSFSDIDLAVNLQTGKELWRSAVEHREDLAVNGTVNTIVLGAQQKYVTMTDGDEIVLSSLTSGKRLYTRKKCEPNADLVKQKRRWFYAAPGEDDILFILDDGVLVVNSASGKEKGFIPLDIDEQYNILQPTTAGCMVFGSEKIIHVNFANGIKTETAADIDEIRSVLTVESDSAVVSVVSLENMLIGLNLTTGKTMWKTPEKFPPAKGFIHRHVSTDENSIIVTYLDPSDDLKLYVMSINFMSGKINYRTLVAHADESLPERTLPLPAEEPVAGFSNRLFGFDRPGFGYAVSGDEERIHILIHTEADMIEPNTTEEGGEGYAIVDRKSGKMEKKQYMKIAQGLSFKGGFDALARPLTVGSLRILAGDKNIVAIDTTDASLKWMLIEQDLNNSSVTDMAMVDSLLLLRTGGSKTDIQFDEKKKKITAKKAWEEDDYALIAVNVNNGRVYWKKEFNENPAALFPGYSAARFSVDGAMLLYGSEKFLYAQALQTKKADSLQWRFEFADSGIGTYSYEDLFNPASFWKNERFEKTPGYTVDSNVAFSGNTVAGEDYMDGVSRVLQVNYNPETKSLIALGEDGIASINPENGRKRWFREWDYSGDAVSYRPVFLGDQLFYCIDGKAELLNLKTGKLTYGVKVGKESGVFIMPNGSCVVLIDKDEITGIIVP